MIQTAITGPLPTVLPHVTRAAAKKRQTGNSQKASASVSVGWEPETMTVLGQLNIKLDGNRPKAKQQSFDLTDKTKGS